MEICPCSKPAWTHTPRVHDCAPDHCTQADVPMIFRTHTPRTCPAITDTPSDPDTSTETNAVRDGGKPTQRPTRMVTAGETP